MELSHLKYFYETAKLEHVSKAAEELHIVQPALTKSIKALENELGVKLFYKQGRNIKLSEYGKFLYEKLSHILTEIENLPLTVKEKKDAVENTVTVNVLSASTLVTHAVVNFKKTHPDVIFKMIQNEAEPDFNILVTTSAMSPVEPTGIAKRAVVEEQIFLAVPKSSPLALKDEIDLKEARQENFVNLSGSRLFRAVCDTYCLNAGFRPQTIFESDSPVAVKNLISAGIGVSFWPEFSWGKISAKDVKLLKIKSPSCKREIIAYLSDTGKETNYGEEFFDYIAQLLQKRKSF